MKHKKLLIVLTVLIIISIISVVVAKEIIMNQHAEIDTKGIIEYYLGK